jgi:hypothetical protein
MPHWIRIWIRIQFFVGVASPNRYCICSSGNTLERLAAQGCGRERDARTVRRVDLDWVDPRRRVRLLGSRQTDPCRCCTTSILCGSTLKSGVQSATEQAFNVTMYSKKRRGSMICGQWTWYRIADSRPQKQISSMLYANLIHCPEGATSVGFQFSRRRPRFRDPRGVVGSLLWTRLPCCASSLSAFRSPLRRNRNSRVGRGLTISRTSGHRLAVACAWYRPRSSSSACRIRPLRRKCPWMACLLT